MTATAMNTVTPRVYTAAEHATWRRLYERLDVCRREQVHPLFARGLAALQITGERVPSLADVNDRLAPLTGWRGVSVQGLEGPRSFFEGLAARKFPIGNFIRDAKDLNYTPTPDVFHDLYGHMPFFADPAYAAFSEACGRAALRYADDPRRLRRFERLYWFGAEFPLVETPQGRRIFGGGILSSFGESNFSLSSEPEVVPFDLRVIRDQEFRIDEMQRRLFLLKSPEQLYACLPEFERLVAAD